LLVIRVINLPLFVTTSEQNNQPTKEKNNNKPITKKKKSIPNKEYKTDKNIKLIQLLKVQKVN
jgi:hypothetical protein